MSSLSGTGSIQNQFITPLISLRNSAENYITTYFPGSIIFAKDENKSFILEAIAHNADNIFSLVTCNTINALQKRIKSDIEKLKKIKHPPINLYYIVDSSKNIITKTNSSLNTYYSEKDYRVILLDEQQIIEQLIIDHNSVGRVKPELLNSYYNQLYKSPQIQNNVLEEIFNHINVENIDLSIVTPFDKKIITLKSKIGVNFKNHNYTEVIDTYNALWTDKELVEHFIRSNYRTYKKQLYAILDRIKSKYKVQKPNRYQSVDFPVNGPIVFDNLADELIPEGKNTDPRYISMTKAIILFFFEYCDFGKKSVDDPPSLFANYSGQDDTSR